ncbi:hypothetical protein FRC03_000145 [Tulasnella sp. 419]|nr:hypothetical protein FRC03_000145 [Tulasnella sp. 419]
MSDSATPTRALPPAFGLDQVIGLLVKGHSQPHQATSNHMEDVSTGSDSDYSNSVRRRI